MFTSFKSSLISLVRDPALLVWALAFPIIMTCIFMGMFSGLSDAYDAVGSRLGVVEDDNYEAALGLDETIQAISDPSSEDRICDLTYFSTAEEAESAERDGNIDIYLTVDGEGTPELHASQWSLSDDGSLPTSVLVEVLDSYLHTREALADVAEKRPDLLAFGEALAAFRADAVKTVQLEATKNAPDPGVRYYYALLAMTAGMGATAAVISVKRLLAPVSALGARLSACAVPRWRMLLGALLASWLCQLGCLVLATLFMWGVGGVNFGDNPLGVAGALVATSAMGCAAGAFLGTFTHMETGVVSAITCLLSLFTGLYGTAAQEFADNFEATMPLLAHANPLWQTANCFYSLLYYDTPDVFLASCATLAGMALAFVALAALRMRRLSYEHL